MRGVVEDFYLVTDAELSKKGILHDVKNAIKAGCKIVQYREKNKNTKAMIKEAEEIKRLCKNKAIFIVNDRVDVALAVNADGVHLGQDDMDLEAARKLLGKEKIIGVTVHTVKEALDVEKKGANYVGLSPIFETTTKKDAGNACGIDMITKVKKKITIPVVAIGGITKENIYDVIKAGADSAAAISAVLTKEDIHKEIADFIKIIKALK